MKIIDKILNIVLCVIFFAYGILDCFDCFDSISFLNEKSDSLMLIAMSVFLFTHLIERNTLLKEIDGKIKNISNVVTKLFKKNIVETIELNSSKMLFNYLSEKINNSKESVYELTWGLNSSILNTAADKSAFENYFNTLLNTIKRDNIDYKEIMTFPSKKRVQRVNKILQNGYKDYKLRYYNISPEEHNKIPPLMEITIIDKNEVILHIYGNGTNAKYVAVQNSVIVQYFVRYFNAIWEDERAIKLIDIDYCNLECIDKLNLIKNNNTDSNMYEKIYS